MTIVDSTLGQNVWDDIVTVLVAASITTSIGSTVTNANIASQYPDKPFTKPQIIVLPPIKRENAFRFQGTEGDKVINVIIECYSPKTLGVQQLADAVETALKADTVSGISLSGIDSDYAFSAPDENKMHLITITAHYTRG